ncbi:conjugal transfer pilus assembly protein TraU [Legionella fallonii]|uniref:Protein TraU n=1 Tax=Legionella fallonii LLAP-10 TaxID=1212491 RepID=A0A098G8D6_9GAMM|nr:conjugal transfer pilus assembly protein TraU [Legionella fallonii]CEG58244.1 Protein TraU [Legionella fallonii LLAP-10]
MKDLFILIAFLASGLTQAGSCHGRFVNPITDVCWSCLFPFSLGQANLVSSNHLPDTKNPKLPVCECPGNPIPRLGLTMGYWEPVNLVDVTRTPFCLVNLGGISLNFGKYYRKGTVETDSNLSNQSFYHVHWYKFPLMYWLNVLTDGICVEQGDFDIAYPSELDAMWNDDELGFIINPEAVLFGSLPAQAACAADSSTALLGSAIDKLFWCAGAQGSMYPLTGHVQEHVGGVQASVLLSERMNFKLHRQGLLEDTVGLDDSTSSAKSICHTHYSPILPKSRYRYQMVNPLPTTNACYPLGRATTLWEAGHEYPFKGEDFGYLIWRKRNCCAF